jgi:UDP-2,3-diacylglucosamine hydrolase
MGPIAVVAGGERMPLRVIEGIREAGRSVLLFAIEEVTPPELEELVQETIWLKYPHLRRIRRECRKRGISEITMVGKVRHNRVFGLSLWDMDWAAIRLFLSLPDLRANTLLGGVIRMFEGWGFRFLSTLQFLGKYIARKGVLTKKAASPAVLRDMEFGQKLAKELGRLDIGQTVVVKNGTVVALEGMEGTDQCLKRAGEVAGPGVVMVKMPKPNQDLRFDVPVIGLDTIRRLHEIGAAGLAVEADRTLIIDSTCVEEADRLGLAIVGL